MVQPNNINLKYFQKYPNHYRMKKNRILKLQQTRGKCEVCGERGFQIHHKDGDKGNHKIENLLLLCRKCHMIIHQGRQNQSKFIKLYGISVGEMVKKYGGTDARFYAMHRKKKLKIFLNIP